MMEKTRINLNGQLSRDNNYLYFRNQNLSNYLIIGITISPYTSLSMAQEMDTDVPVGWAAVPGYGLESTTGGGNGNVVAATTAGQLSSYAGSFQPLVIIVEGTISGSGTINVASNKTIIFKTTRMKLSIKFYSKISQKGMNKV
jgi:pectate lyase